MTDNTALALIALAVLAATVPAGLYDQIRWHRRRRRQDRALRARLERFGSDR